MADLQHDGDAIIMDGRRKFVPVTVHMRVTCGCGHAEDETHEFDLPAHPLKHAFAEKPAGHVRIELRSSGVRQRVLEVSDDGVEIPQASIFLVRIRWVSLDVRGNLIHETLDEMVDAPGFAFGLGVGGGGASRSSARP